MSAELLTGEVAVITGGASGIGRAIARGFADHGAAVVVADVRTAPREGGTPTHELIREGGGEAVFVECDVRSREDLERAAATAGDLGGLSIMVNNAGIFHGETLGRVEEETVEDLLSVNVLGTFLGAQVAGAHIDEGSIINLSSVAGTRGTSLFAAYCATKGAVRTMTYALAAELGPDIRVNAIHPGLMETAMTTEDVPVVGGLLPETEAARRIPAGRFGTAGDVVGTAVYLASDMAGYVTGASVPVDGGLANTVIG